MSATVSADGASQEGRGGNGGGARRVGFFLKPEKPESRELVGKLVPWLRARSHVPLVADEDQVAIPGAVIVPRARLGRGLDLAVCLGGDGTILGASALIADAAVPVLGINLGRLGFLTPFDPNHALETLEAAINGDLPTSKRMRLAVTYIADDGTRITRLALNDVVIHQGSMARLIEVEARLNGELVANYRADGLIIATPTGSTAYNLAAGGPIIVPGQEVMAITPTCAHSLTSRPLVVSGTSTIAITLDGEARGVVLTVDGQWAQTMMLGARIEVAASEQPLVVFDSDKSYFDILREKLHWGARSDRIPSPEGTPDGQEARGSQ